MASTMRSGTGAAVVAVMLALTARTAAGPPDLVLKTRVFLPGKDVVEPYGENYIYTPTAPQNGRLIVLFPGSSMGRYKSFMTAAAAHGYHVLGLNSPMTAAKGDAENAITHRLVAILQYLKAEKQGSGQFLLCRDAEPCQPDWPKITVAGQGNGAAVASSLLERHQGSGMKMLYSADCPDLEDDDEGGCWDRFLAPH
jgi:hypothetical protein